MLVYLPYIHLPICGRLSDWGARSFFDFFLFSVGISSETLWVIFINILLGVIIFGIVIIVCWAFAKDVHQKAGEQAELKRARKDLSRILPKLGLTLYDGGEKVKEKRKR